MKQHSSGNTYSTSDGRRFSRVQIEVKIREAKRQVIQNLLAEHGHVFCYDCHQNTNAGQPIDCSHTISVKESLESGKAELAWSVFNIRMRCRTCHNAHDQS